jgi:ATP-dependent RNA helicase DHX33
VQRIRKSLFEAGTTVEQLRTLHSASGAKTNGVNGHGGRLITPLKLVIMSATLDPSKFVDFFQTQVNSIMFRRELMIRNRPALIVKGRMYDVATQHLLAPVDDYVEAAAKQVMAIHLSPNSVADGDVLVFMPGAEEIEMCAEILRRAIKEMERVASHGQEVSRRRA